MVPGVEWAERAACRGRREFVDLDHRYQRAVCKDCPVQFECLQWALEVESDPTEAYWGTVYGGLTGHQRARLLRQRAQAA